jgi:hypothetical protein
LLFIQGTSPKRIHQRHLPLHLTQTTGFDVHSVSDDTWTETGITYNNAPAVNSTIVGSSGAVTANTWR